MVNAQEYCDNNIGVFMSGLKIAYLLRQSVINLIIVL